MKKINNKIYHNDGHGAESFYYKALQVQQDRESYGTICTVPYARLLQGLTPCSDSVVYSRGITVDDHLSLESPAVDQLKVFLTPPAISEK